MSKLKHSKFKNTGILFELLVKQIASDTLANKDSLALEVIKKHFKRGTELNKELKLYQALTKENFDSQYKAQEFVNIILEERNKLNEGILRRQKYNLIKSIKESFETEFRQFLEQIVAMVSSQRFVALINAFNIFFINLKHLISL